MPGAEAPEKERRQCRTKVRGKGQGGGGCFRQCKDFGFSSVVEIYSRAVMACWVKIPL